MSSAVLPTFPGVAYPVMRSLMDDVTVQQSLSGKETRTNNQTTARYKWTLIYNVLRSAAAYGEYQSLLGFINARYGRFDSFLYQDALDNAATAQTIGLGNGSTTSFQLVRAFGGFVEPVLAPNTVSNIYLNGANQSSGWSVSSWGSASPGMITFTAPPASGVVITASFTFYWPCRFDMSSYEFSEFCGGLYEMKKLTFISLKN